MKKDNKILMIIALVSISIGAIVFEMMENRLEEKLSKYKMINFDQAYQLDIRSAYYIDKYYVINDSLTFNAFQKNNGKGRFLYEYLMRGDKMYKRANNDTLYILRNYNIEKFVVIRDDGSEPVLTPREIINL